MIEQAGGPEVLQLREIVAPESNNDEMLVRVRAFGLNRAEVYRRQGKMGPMDSPAVPGIEAAGEVIRDPSGTFRAGQCVATAMGGLQFSRPGSYAEQVSVLARNVNSLDGTVAPKRRATYACLTPAWKCHRPAAFYAGTWAKI